jgi:cell division protein FtsI (penicillin-binding protein 3)
MRPPPFFPRKESKLAGTRRSALDLARGRLVLVSALFVLAYIMVAARVFDLSVIQGSLPRAESAETQQPAAADEAPVVMRADITDRNGVLLATSLQTASLYADSMQVPEPEKVASGLVKILPDLIYGDVLEKLQRKTHFVWIKRNLTPQEQYAVLTLGQPGLMFRNEMRRIYPQGPLAAHMVGYTDIDGHGLAGIERSFDSLLRQGGGPLRLTLDIRLQHILRREMQTALGTFSAKAGAGVIMDVATGQVLAAVSLPDFDPDDLSSANDDEIFNRVTLGTYELGSTFKIFTLAAVLENLNPPMSQLYDARAPLQEGRFTISDFEPKNRMLSLPEVFMYSSNIGAAEMGQAVGTDGMKKFYDDLGLLSPMKIEIGEVGKPQFPQPWRDINTLTAAFGHGIAVTPLQMVSAASTIAGGGTLVQPTLVLGDGAAKPASTKVRIVSEQTAHRMRQLLRLVVTDGTGTHADVPGYNVGGKTGTAEKPGPHGGYDSKRLISSFIAFFPVDAPKYAVYIMIDEPHGTKKTFGFATGGFVAAPAVARVIASMAAVLGIAPERMTPLRDLTASLRPYLQQSAGGHSYLASY